MENVSRVTLTRNSQTAILQGMHHVAPRAFYENIQMDLDHARDRGDIIFMEGIQTEDLPPPDSFGERMIRIFWEYLFESYEILAETEKLQLEKDCLTYPNSSLVADVDLAKLARLMYDNHCRCVFLTFCLSIMTHEERLKLIAVLMDAILDKKSVSENWRMRVLKNLFTPLCKKMYPIVITYRNSVAMDMIRSCDKGGNLFVTYGESHIPGLIDLFCCDGWVVQEVQTFNTHNMRSPIRIKYPA